MTEQLSTLATSTGSLPRSLGAAVAVVIMGVSASGKTTLAHALARQTGALFIEADDYHSTANRAKMSAGIPLTDQDRWPWLYTLYASSHHQETTSISTPRIFITCSCLKRSYRDVLRSTLDYSVCFLYLRMSPECARVRITRRTGHFMPASMIDSQFAMLEEPTAEEQDMDVAALEVDSTMSAADVLAAACTVLGLSVA
ncbi:P-loop containing nucleoside triphosphate hydrolase protein [Thamnocephalis sphaerospora]|uniref:Gluconokinase n=1 Tax=Thamnocephalis sphaerospora TaxID=78915 RepID=A0A4P9XX88_9FUNG|nr:P-loop containing nucleoside triphosphate hydrolase protein [Thamnocephalis sphaerospora]|eukprot:RKP10924.1 P-loop containing nucleoside triphosphate hydrolase protein [Thamnocephalis sphaerospora]